MGSTPAPQTAATATTARGISGGALWIDRVTLAAMIAPAGFFVMMTVLGLVTPGYNAFCRELFCRPVPADPHGGNRVRQ